MDIVNWLYLKKAELIRDAIDSPEDLVLLGADVSFEKRGDKYITYAVPVSLLMGGSSSITLKTNGTNNTVQTTLDLVEGNNITITDNGDGSVTIDSTSSPGETFDSNEGIYKDTALTNDTFMLGAPNGSQGTIPFTINRYISVSDKILQIEGTAAVLKLIEGNATLSPRSCTLEVTAENNFRAGQFTALNTEAVRINTYANTSSLVVENLANNSTYNSSFVNEYGGGLDVKSRTDSRFWIYRASPNSINNVIDIQSIPSAGPFTAGQGTSITFQPGIDLGNNIISNGTVLNSVFSNVTANAAVVDFRIDTFNQGLPLIHSTFIGNGQLRLHNYTTGSSFSDLSGPSIGVLNVDNNGNVFVGAGTPVTITANEGVTTSTPTNVQLGASSYAGSTFSTDRFIDTTTKALFIKGQVASSFTPGGIKTGVLNITNDLASGTPVGLIVNVIDTNITSGRGIIVNTSKATGIEVLSSTGRAIDISTASTAEKCAYITSASTTALEISTQGSGINRLAIEALKYGSDNNVVEPVISVTKSSNAGTGAIGIGSSIRFSAATSTAGVVNELGNLAYVATNVASGAMSSYFRVAARDLGTEKYVLTVDAKGIFTLVQGLGNYPNDAAAAIGGVPLNGLYRNGSAVQIRSI